VETAEKKPDAEAESPSEPAEKSGPSLTKWREIWPLPLLGMGGILLAAGVYMAVSTAPDPVFAPALENADRLIRDGQYETAIDELNERVYPYLGRAELGPASEARFRVLLARALFGGQHDLEFPQPINDENIVSQFLAAEKIADELAQSDIERLAKTYISQGDLARAKVRADELIDPATTAELYREIIDVGRNLARPDYADLSMTVDEYLNAPGLGDTDRVWGLARRAEMQIELGYTSEAIDGLLREMPLLIGRDIPGSGELFVLLGRGYLESGAFREAIHELERADNDAILPPEDPARAQGRLYLAEATANIAVDDDELRLARDMYEEVSQGGGEKPVYLAALFGLARTESALNDDDAAMEAYDALITEMSGRDAPPRPTAEEVSESMEAVAVKHESSWAAGGAVQEIGLMLRYSERAMSLFTIDSAPTPLLALLSRGHEASARTKLGFGPETTGKRFSLDDLRELDPATLRQAKRHLIQAASFARINADRYIIDNYDTYADMLWRSALLSDAAGDRAQAIASLTLFADTVQTDPRQPEARFRLGQLFQSKGEYKTAAGYYSELIEESRGEDTSGAGQWADLSFVPLAQCYIADVDDSNDDDAVRLLEQSIDGTRGGPDRPEFLQAVVELGHLAMRQGRYNDAIARYEEVLERDPDSATPAIRFKLGDALRMLAAEIEDRLKEPLSDRETGILSSERASHLRAAIDSFKAVRDALEKVEPRSLSELQATYLRNAYFYLGDCAFDLGQFDESIEFYSMARARYPREPAVLVALMQVVNAHIELGDLSSARTANERAKAYYQTLPAEVWDDPNLPLDRREWQRWLDANARLYEGYAKGG